MIIGTPFDKANHLRRRVEMEMRNSKGLRLFAITFLFLLGGVSVAHADLVVTLDDPSTAGVDISIQDNSAGDMNSLVGAVTYIGNFGNFDLNVTTAFSKPIGHNTPFSAEVDLNSVNVVSGTGGTLVVSTSDNGFVLSGPAQYAMISSLGGVLAGGPGSSVTAQQWLAYSNELFDVSGPGTITPGVQGPFSPGAFASTEVTDWFNYLGAPFSLTERVSITFSGPGSTSFNINSHVLPEPGTALLLGFGFLGVAAWHRITRRSGKKTDV
jgi:hypothetical protein